MSSKNKRLMISLFILLALFAYRYFNSNAPFNSAGENQITLTQQEIQSTTEALHTEQHITSTQVQTSQSDQVVNSVDDLVLMGLLETVENKDGKVVGWRSQAGIFYGMGSKEGNRVYHLFAHLKPDSSKPIHSVFETDKAGLITLIDEAWNNRENGVTKVQANGNRIYDIDMDRTIGTEGEQKIRIVIREGTDNIITAYPKK